MTESNTTINNLISEIFNNTPQKKELDIITTGSIAIDMITGLGGIPMGSIIEILGGPKSGKAALMLSILAEVQKLGGIPVLFNTDQDLHANFADTMGVDIQKVLAAQADNLTEMFEMIIKLAQSDEVDAIFIDTITGILLDEDAPNYKKQEQLLIKFLMKLLNVIQKTKTIIVFTSQLKTIKRNYKIVTSTSGGTPIKNYSNLRFFLTKKRNIRELYTIVGHTVNVDVIKNTYNNNIKSTQFDLIYKTGIDTLQELINHSIEFDLIKKSGSWYIYEDMKIQGMENLKIYLRENPSIIEKIKAILYNFL